MALSTVYNVLHRNGWRKLAPDKRHPQSDEQAEGQWKKTARTARRDRCQLDRAGADQGDIPGRGPLWAHQRG